MTWTKIKRVVTAGFFSFWRNGFVSLASVLVMTVTMIVLGMMIILNLFFPPARHLRESPLHGARDDVAVK